MTAADLQTTLSTTSAPTPVSGVAQQKKPGYRWEEIPVFSSSNMVGNGFFKAGAGTLYAAYAATSTNAPGSSTITYRDGSAASMKNPKDELSKMPIIFAFQVTGGRNYSFEPGVGIAFTGGLHISGENAGLWFSSVVYE